MEIRFVRKTKDSYTGNCPALYEVTELSGGFVVQGKKLDAETRAQLRDLGADEDGVWIPRDVIYPGE